VFIPVAERSGLIGPLGRWVLSEAAAALIAWDSELTEHFGVTVNLSAHQLAEADLERSVEEVLATSCVDPSRICLEITETALVQDPAGAAAVLDRLKALGLGIAIDDFGTGYASLDHLRRFPMADMLKIDRTFVDGVAQPGTNDAAIVAAAVGLGRSLGMVTCAEGVETEAQAAVLLELGCDRLQGNLFGAAVPAAEVPALVRGAGAGHGA
jgi:EAL domain-containing protein (putative c-di-GMP-specific phosphodiesterase class I)